MKHACSKRKVIAHFVGLTGIGGVQSNFVEYMKYIELNPSKYQHKIYTVGSVDPHYRLDIEVFDIRKILNLLRLMLDIVSRDTITHFYNNLSSLKLAFFLVLLPTRKLIVHERGTIWNQRSSSWLVPRFVAWKASIILSNSFATKVMLVKKFSIPENKIKVVHNGVNISIKYDSGNDDKRNSSIFRIGFIGRLDSPKGVHVLIDAMHNLENENIELIIAGEGVLGNSLRNSAHVLSNVKFIGRVKNPYFFMNKIDLLVVPSIREPLGNVCLEAGLCKTPVLASNIDGIPEIIEHKVTGELINATDEILVDMPEGVVPLPEFVVDPISEQLQMPKQINPSLLAIRILELSKNPDQLKIYADELHKKVNKCFGINKYGDRMNNIYQNLFSS
jgi:glycosyltransferase involved in cell wall biosynthesis